MDSGNPSDNEERKTARGYGTKRGPSFGTVVLGLALIGGLFWLTFYIYTAEKVARGTGQILDLGNKTVDAIAKTVVGISENMRPQAIAMTFAQWRQLETKGNLGNILEVATATSTETFTRVSELRIASLVSLGTTVSEISVPATYRYHIDLNGSWQIKGQEDGTLVVVAPPLLPSLPVAFDTSGLKKKTQSGWGRWNAEENLTQLEASLSPQLAVRAADKRTLQEVSDPARRSVAEFVKRWLISQDHWKDGRYRELHVLFPNELPPGGLEALSLKDRVPTIKLGAEPTVLKPAT
ncbi:MAG TPA: hypothetical protein P5016_09750 [Verrucomicrobiales bacterium]|nr:hypothetical protein [Akkermansiaceae bacterium]HRX54786.1 hypothetical protein [Verrucomicrobiales bacterium]